MKELTALFRIVSFLAYSGMWCYELVEEVGQFTLTTRTVDSPFLHASGQKFYQQLLTFFDPCCLLLGEHFCLAVFTSMWQPLLARL